MSESGGGRTALAGALFRTGALRLGRVTLSDGRPSSYFIDLSVVLSDPEAFVLAVAACEAAADGLGRKNFDVIAGIGNTGSVLAAPLALAWKKPLLCVRRGDGREQARIEGATRPGWKTLMVDDVVGTGSTLAAAAEALRRAGCVVKDAVVLVDRLEGGKGRLAAGGVRLTPFLDVKELAETLHANGKVTKADLQAMLKQIERTQS